ncbi:MAG: T9SS type A sorting domain-containing protein [Candidatus Delongbacteria bacterium]|jgi:tetratricopeptide (TPR) repeat protein|nr:T9SS type A sorting domain-containing protein [Candidatus Delongbacteria bacterium]
MRKIIVSVIFILTIVLFSQNITTKEETEKASKALRPDPIKGHVELPIFFATFKGDADPKMVINSLDVTDATAPAMFRMPNGQMIADYIADNATLSFYELFKPAVEDYLKTVTKEALTAKVVYYTNPNDPDGLWRMPEKENYFYYSNGDPASPEEVFRLASQAVIDSALVYYPELLTVDGDLKDNLNFFYPRCIFKGSDGNGAPQDFDYTNGQDDDVRELRFRTVTLMDPYSNLNQVLYIMVHEVGHMLMRLGDRGNDESIYYGGKIDGEFMGLTKCTAPPYDLMFHNGMMGAPYSLYGLAPVHTWDMIHQTYLDSTDFAILNEEDHDLHFTNNKCEQTIRNVRQILSGSDYSSDIKSGIIIPITTDIMEENEEVKSRTFKNVESQNFLIELRSGTDYDNIGGVGHDEASKGVLISHIINCYQYKYDPFFYPDILVEISQYWSYKPIIDIESATPYPVSDENGDPYRDSTFCYINPDMNGTFYNGKDVNDWMDDIVTGNYDSEGGETAYPSTSLHASLPSDFFNDTNLNKFTPSTRPSSNSYKQVNLHLGIYINKIEGDYADISVYKNYWSNPLIADIAKDIKDGKSGLVLPDYSYFGENFYVDSALYLQLGDGVNLTGATLVPGTDMHVKRNSDVYLLANCTLRLESSKLTMEAGSGFQAFDTATIELDNSELNFNDGALIETKYVDNYNITVDGQSSIQYSNFDLFEGSLLTLKSSSQFVLKSGTNLNIPVGSTLLLEDNSELVVESGSNLSIAPGSIISLGEGAKITLKNSVNLNLDGVTFTGTNYNGIIGEDGSSMTIQDCSFTGAYTAISGSPDYCKVTNSVFTDGTNGVSLFGTNSYYLASNYFMGNLQGTAIKVIQSNGKIMENQIKGFFRGIYNISCSPKVYGNSIKNNARNGLMSSGLNSVPVLIDMTAIDIKSTTKPSNTIINNGDGYIGHPVLTIYTPSQISVVNGSNIYMKYCNNYIYPSAGSDVPCILAAKRLLQQPGQIVIPTIEYYIDARGNYWGTNYVTSDMFYTDPYYSIDYGDSITIEDGTPLTSPLPESDSKPYKLLIKALTAELDGKYDKAISTYEKIIEKYPDSDEALVAYSKLPDSYVEEGLSLEPLISLYDGQLALDDDKVNKKFFKEMKVATHIKGKKYDEAIAISEEMKVEADSEEEEVLCEIDIAIASMLKGNSKGSSKTDYEKTLHDLLVKLNGSEEEGEVKTDIAGSALPTEFTLYQNYPNPFNPVTQIKFALPNVDNVRLNIYNISGQLVSELVNGSIEAGIHTVSFDASNLNSGMYFYTLEANGMSITKKMILTK